MNQIAEIIPLLICSFFAGFIDSIAGGGGLIQLPALLVLAPNYPLAMLFGTNKFSSICGTSFATFRYYKVFSENLQGMIPAAFAGFVSSFLGSMCVSLINKDLLKPIIVLLLVLVAIYTIIKKDLGSIHKPKVSHEKQKIIGLIAGIIIGFYDGFFGPGTGSFLIFIFISFIGFDFINSSASSKIINLATNLASVIYFASTNNINYKLALPMACCNVLGAFTGTKTAIKNGNKFVKMVFLIVVITLIAKLIFDFYIKGK